MGIFIHLYANGMRGSKGRGFTTLHTAQTDLSATDIMTRAYAAAGGETWTRPQMKSFGHHML